MPVDANSTVPGTTWAIPTPMAASRGVPSSNAPSEFVPVEPTSLAQTGLSDQELEALILKQLYTSGTSNGRRIAEQIKLPFAIVQEVPTKGPQPSATTRPN
jgi:hypothetical protein